MSGDDAATPATATATDPAAPWRVVVGRQACCMADDMSNPLELAVDLPADATLEDLARAVVAADFLQFSSTHHTLTGRAEGAGRYRDRPVLLRVVHHWLTGRRVHYVAAPRACLRDLLPEGRLSLVFEDP